MIPDAEAKELCNTVRQTAFEIHAYLKNGFLEKIYENALFHRLSRVGFRIQRQAPLQVRDQDETILGEYLADLLVENEIVVEFKAARALAPEHLAQTLGYLRAARLRHALLLNFGAPVFQARKLVL